MSRSPFAGRDNATLTFQIPTGKMKSNSRGNPVPETDSMSIRCYMKSERGARNTDQPGVNQNEEPMVGYAVEPMQMPDSIKDGAKAQAQVGQYSGEFVLKLVTLPNAEFEREAGTKFYGTFTRQV